MVKTRLTKQDFAFLEKKITDIRDKALKKADLQRVGKQTVSQMKDFISKGISPIEGMGRFPGYKKSYQDQIQGKVAFFKRDGIVIPFKPKAKDAKFASKRVRPVNLYLTGQQMDSLTFKAISNSSLDIGYFNGAAQKKEQGHREGANGQLKRPTIPQGSEKLAVSIQRTIVDEMVRLINNYIKATK